MIILLGSLLTSFGFSEPLVTATQKGSLAAYRFNWCETITTEIADEFQIQRSGITKNEDCSKLIGHRDYSRLELQKLSKKLIERRDLNFDSYFPTWKELEHYRLKISLRDSKIVGEALSLSSFLYWSSKNTRFGNPTGSFAAISVYLFWAIFSSDHIYYAFDHLRYFAIRLNDELIQWNEVQSPINTLELILKNDPAIRDITYEEALKFDQTLLDELP